MRRNKQAGFSIVEAAIAIAIIGIIGVAGWFVYQQNRLKTTDAASSPSPSQQTNTTPPATSYLTITEWGVRLALNSDTASLYYYINPDEPNVAFLSLHNIAAVAPLCAADKSSLGAISRLTPAQHQDALAGKAYGIPGTIQVGNYWYGYEGTHADCTGGSAPTQAAVSKAAPHYDASLLQNTFTTLQAIPASN